MPKSKVRKKNDFTVNPVSRTPVKVKAGPSSVWFVVFFFGLMLIGLVWLLVFQLAPTSPPFLADSDRAMDYAIAFAFMIVGLVAHDALALPAEHRMNSPWVSERYRFRATFWSTNHTV